MKWIMYLIPLILLFCTSQEEHLKTKLEIRDGYYYINNQKTFINALGYEIGARPGQHPYKDEKKLELARMRSDLRVIKEAGFNAVRTWSELAEPEVQLVQESGLYLIYGIWIEPFGDFGDSAFVAAAEQQVEATLNWSKNYDCIIAYLIMNEPMPAHIHDKGAKITVALWKRLRDIIHQQHPGIPVTISNNSAIGDFINENIFDVYGYNTYNYNEGLPGYTQGFANHFEYLKDLNGQNKPLLVTEFGLSVSPIGYGMYGGNTRKRQASHIIDDFRATLDAGVAGVCPFYYADGWWKGGDSLHHDPVPEEWFGYWGYADSSDTVGHPRPIWYEFQEYNQALITEPRNQRIYGQTVPVELFLKNPVIRVKIVYDDRVIFNKIVAGSYLRDEVTFPEEEIKDRELIFEFYDSRYRLLKWESIMILTSQETVPLPKIEMTFNEQDLSRIKTLRVDYRIINRTPFKLDKTFKYLYAHHIWWNPGDHRSREIQPDQTETTISDSWNVPDDCLVLNVAAGIDIRFGKFVKRIYNQKLLYRGNWAEPISVESAGYSR